MINIFISFSAVQIYYLLVLFTFYEYIPNSQSNQLPVGLMAQLVEHSNGIAEVMGSYPIQA